MTARRSGIFALLLAVGSTCAASTVVEASLAAVASFEHADFVQRRIVPALEQPLVSSGSVALSDRGFVWEQHEPFRNTVTFDGETVSETTQVGTERISRPLNDVATVNLTRTLFEMLSGSWSTLGEAFDLELASHDGGQWLLRLVPEDSNVRSVIPEITVSGSRYIERVRVRQSDDGETIIELANQRGSR
jgi:hypothetical protein